VLVQVVVAADAAGAPLALAEDLILAQVSGQKVVSLPADGASKLYSMGLRHSIHRSTLLDPRLVLGSRTSATVTSARTVTRLSPAQARKKPATN
jgi:hypothetical protein